MSSAEQLDGNGRSGGSAPGCSLCDVTAEGCVDGAPPLGWSTDLIETSAGTRPRWICGQCTRRFVRSIEAKLDQQWW